MDEKKQGFSVGRKTIFFVVFFHGLFILFLGIESSIFPKTHSLIVRSVQVIPGKIKSPNASSKVLVGINADSKNAEKEAIKSVSMPKIEQMSKQEEKKITHKEEKLQQEIKKKSIEKEMLQKEEKPQEKKPQELVDKKQETTKKQLVAETSSKKMKVDDGKKKTKAPEKKEEIKNTKNTKGNIQRVKQKKSENSLKNTVKEASRQKAKRNQELTKLVSDLQSSFSQLEEASATNFKGGKKTKGDREAGDKESGGKQGEGSRGRMPLFIQNLEIDAEIEGDAGGFFDSSYQARLVSELKNELKLPEVGEVKAKLSIDQEGKVSDVEIIYSRSRKNERYLKNTLPCLNFPWFNAFVSGSEKKQFSIVFRNEDF